MGFRPHTTRHFCFGKSAQNHFRPSAALQRMVEKLTILFRVPPPTPRIRWRENSLRSNSSRRKVDSGLRLRRIQRRRCPQKKKTPKTNSNFSGFSDRTKRIYPVISSLTRNLECGRTTDFSLPPSQELRRTGRSK